MFCSHLIRTLVNSFHILIMGKVKLSQLGYLDYFTEMFIEWVPTFPMNLVQVAELDWLPEFLKKFSETIRGMNLLDCIHITDISLYINSFFLLDRIRILVGMATQKYFSQKQLGG